MSTAVAPTPSLRGPRRAKLAIEVGEWDIRGSRRPRLTRKSMHWPLVALIAAVSGTAHAQDNEIRWRVFDQGDAALLVIADTDDATDNLGLPVLSCKSKFGSVEIEGEAKENLRFAMADLIRADETPWIQVLPDTAAETTTIDVFFSFIDGWRYKFIIGDDHKSFDRFKREGVLEFKLGKAMVHEEFKVGLVNVTKFLELCERPARN